MISRYGLMISRYNLMISRYNMMISRYGSMISRYGLMISRNNLMIFGEISWFLSTIWCFLVQFDVFSVRFYNLMTSRYGLIISRYNPPTPAFAKAGAAPGTTGGVELGCLGSRLLFARLQTFQTLPQASKATGIQVNNSYSYMPLPSVFQGVQDCRLPAFKRSKRSQRSRRPPRQQLLQLHALAISRQQLLQLYNNSYTAIHAPAICFSGGSRLPFARLQMFQMLPQASKATGLQVKSTTLTATCPCHLFFRGFKTAVCPPSNAPNASAGLQGLSKPSRRPPRQQLSALATCFSGGSRLPFARLQMLQTPPQASKATTLTAIQLQLYMPLPSVFQQGNSLQVNNSYSYMPLPSVFRGSRLPFARLQMLQTPPQASKATTLTCRPLQTLPQASKATTLCPCHLFFRGFKTAVCPPSNAPNASAGLQGNNSYSYTATAIHALAICFSGGSRLPFAHLQMLQTPPFTCRPLQTLPQASKATIVCPCHLFFRGFKTAVCPPSNAPNASAGLRGNNSYSYSYIYMPLPSVFQGVQDCRLRLQMFQMLPQASKATGLQVKSTTLTATCPCHLFFRGF